MRRLKDIIGNGRLWRGLLGVSVLALVSGCGWLGFGSGSPDSQKARPGADRKLPASAALPAAKPGNPENAEPGATTAPAPVTKAPIAPPPATEPPAGPPKT